MSTMNRSPVWYPPAFPLQGRLPRRSVEVQQNILRQCQLERDYQDALCAAAGYRVTPPCCKTLHVSLFFDGTGNNLNNDLFESTPAHPTNIARLFRATIGEGHAGGMGHRGKQAASLIDGAGAGYGQYFKYYMPGVGTPFAEVGDLDYSNSGLVAGWFGEERINWGLLMIFDALRRTLDQPRLDNEVLRAAVKEMGTLVGLESLTGGTNRRAQFVKQFKALEKPLRIALSQPQPGQSKLLGIKLYVYGFSRGAAAARAFVSWLDQLMDLQPGLKYRELEVPLTVEYLGILDTVASVGIADIVPGARGHLAWADSNQELPKSSLVKRCLHLVASHEQRICFPLESIRRQSGEYPDNCEEVIYPGVHSDLGGGYPPGDQGKASGLDDRLQLSQIALNDLYADAFANGAPMKVPEGSIPSGLLGENWRLMDPELSIEFETSSDLQRRFNAWRQVTLGLPPAALPTQTEQPDSYQPIAAETSLEPSIRNQLGWITAWRIDRYGFASLKETNFYKEATDTHAPAIIRKEAKDLHKKKQAKIEDSRRVQLARERGGRVEKVPLQPGLPDFDADMAQTQLREAAEEFAKAYRNPDTLLRTLTRLMPAASAPRIVADIITADAYIEGQELKAVARGRVGKLFPPFEGYRSHIDERTRGQVDEYRNKRSAEGLLRELFDDQVHDSRAWFLYEYGREPLGSYFRERMVFFGHASRREVAVHGETDTSLMADAVMDAERLAQARQSINARWAAYYDQVEGVTDDFA